MNRSKSNLEVAESVCDPTYWLSHSVVNFNYKDDAVEIMEFFIFLKFTDSAAEKMRTPAERDKTEVLMEVEIN